MAAIERLVMPTNIPVTGTVVYDVKKDDPGKTFPSTKGEGDYTVWGVVIKVISHPDVPAGTVGRVSCYEDEWVEVLASGIRKGDTATFLYKEKINKETGRKFRVLTVTKGGSEDAGDAHPAQPQRQERARPAPSSAMPLAAACDQMAMAYKRLVARGVDAEVAGPMTSTLIIAIGKGDLAWGGFDDDEPTPF